MALSYRFRRGTAAQWTSANPVLASGEPGYVTDTGDLRVGDGTTAWNSSSTASGYIQVREAPLSPYRYGLTDAMMGDSTSVTAVTTALQATINALPAKGGSMVIPRGEWFCNGIVTSGRQFAIAGHGMQATALRLVNHADNNTPMIHVSATTSANYGAGTISDLTIGLANGYSAANPGPCIKVEGAYAADVVIKDVWLGGGNVGIHIKDAPNCAIRGVIVENCQGSGIYVEGATDLTITDAQAWQNFANGIEIINATGVNIVGGKVIENYNNGVRAANSTGVGIVGTVFDNNSKDYSSGTHVNYNLFDNVRFTGVNGGHITGTQHICVLGYAFTRKGVDIDNTSTNIDVLGGLFPSSSFRTDDIANASSGGQILTAAKHSRSAATTWTGSADFYGALNARGQLAHIGSTLGFYNTTPIAKRTGTPANATDLATAIALVNALKAHMVALGLVS